MSGADTDAAARAFIDKWAASDGGERSNYQLFLTELCALIGAPKPEAASADESRNAYVFERAVPNRRLDGPDSRNFIDLYKRGCFVLEAKQSAKRVDQLREVRQLEIDMPAQRTGSGRRGGAQWDVMMRNARAQAERYAKNLPAAEGWPPFLVVVDVGHVIELYADFSLQGKHYAQFPDRTAFRIHMEDLADETVRERLRRVWTDPESLNPARRSAEVTRDVAALLAELSKSLETRLLKERAKEGPEARRAVAELVATFLMRCLFTMFAEDIDLLRKGVFTQLLEDYADRPERVHLALEEMWSTMNKGGFSPALREDVKKFNGGLFREASALPITADELKWLTIAARRDWKDVEPAIFGTLLERALDPQERHALGAHYTPRAYVERLVVATLIEPLSDEWTDVHAAAQQYRDDGEIKRAREAVAAFHRKLCEIRVLDPACGTGNFLYVAMELMKRLEGEVLEALSDLGGQDNFDLDRMTVDPHQFLGIELNPRAAAIAELVLWIGYLQWHFRTRGRGAEVKEPILKNFANIECRDALLAHDGEELQRDGQGRPVSRWDGRTMKLHPVTGEEVPDDAARIELKRYKNPKAARWPEADFIVGNPPFIGGKDLRAELGDGYAEALWKARPHMPGGADLVMHFWDKAAETARAGKARRFGFITTNSITQKFSRKVIERHLGAKKPLSLLFAVPDHPWMKAADRAAVRIAMTVGAAGEHDGVLRRVIHEADLNTDAPTVMLDATEGKIWSNLTVGANTTAATPLLANEWLCSPGVKLHGAGFIVTPQEAKGLGLGSTPGLERHIRPYRNGRDLTSRPRGVMVIDLFGLTQDQTQERFPEVYQWLHDRVRPDRQARTGATKDATEYARRWHQFGKPRSELRKAMASLIRFIATVETSKHRFFQFFDAQVAPDNMLVCIALEDAFHLGVLSSRIHVAWALAAGGRLGVGNDPRYNKTRCFDPFPFPDPAPPVRERIRDLGEKLDAHRKQVLDRRKQLTMTKLYNVLEKVRAGETLGEAERDVYDAGLVGVLQSLHDDLDAAVADAYGWPLELSEAEILQRLVDLNAARAAEERRGKIRWLRPAFQAPKAPASQQTDQMEAELVAAEAKAQKPSLPSDLPDQVRAIRGVLTASDGILLPEEVASRFRQGRRVQRKVEDVLRTLVVTGRAERAGDGYLSAE
ncbi:MAG: class I SAM-dependent DNA methyltransferase [Marivibrio sp.]|uniref:class I SAM-dependent DNA methyltransferase n=1 Tax=Marivibrio sp. TaxID=2039719 RepID=UPI0032EF28DD